MPSAPHDPAAAAVTDDAPVVRLDAVSRIYTAGTVQVPALNGVSLEIPAHRFAMIVGPSGSGKTTLLNLIGCIDRPTTRHDRGVRRDGRDGSRDNALADFRARNIGFIFQDFNLIPVLSAFENVEYPLLLVGMPPPSGGGAPWRCWRRSGLADAAPAAAQPALRRPEAARRDRARAGEGAAAGAGRRADRQPRHPHRAPRSSR